jgi:hypothetical protein
MADGVEEEVRGVKGGPVDFGRIIWGIVRHIGTDQNTRSLGRKKTYGATSWVRLRIFDMFCTDFVWPRV